MAIPHAQPAELIDVRPPGDQLPAAQTTTLIKTDSLDVLRVVMPAEKELPPRQVSGEITLQCLEGKVQFTARGATRELTSGRLVYLRGSDEHSLRAVEDSSLLLTILLKPKSA